MLNEDGVARLGRLTPTLAKFLYIGIVSAVLQLLVSLMELSGFVDIEAGQPLVLVLLSAAIYIFGFSLLVITFVLFARWILQAARNLVAKDIDGFTYTPASCVWWYFVPIASLFKPFQAMRQIWNGSHGNDGQAIDEGHESLTIWWAAWVISGILGNISFRLQMSADGTDMANMATSLFMASALVDLVAYPAAIILVTTINTAQQQTLR
jgi:hypothetical protein